MKNIMIELDNLLAQVEQYNKKAELITDDLEQGYFSLSEESDIAFCHENAKIKCHIVQDYICFMNEILSRMNNIIEKVIKSNKDD